MRSRARDVSPVIQFSLNIVDAVSGSGIAQPGSIPFAFTRVSTGVYGINLDGRLRPIQAQVTPAFTRQVSVAVDVGFIQVVVTDSTGAVANGNFNVSVTAIDKRL